LKRFSKHETYINSNLETWMNENRTIEILLKNKHGQHYHLQRCKDRPQLGRKKFPSQEKKFHATFPRNELLTIYRKLKIIKEKLFNRFQQQILNLLQLNLFMFPFTSQSFSDIYRVRSGFSLSVSTNLYFMF
jgi:hypothetical protein